MWSNVDRLFHYMWMSWYIPKFTSRGFVKWRKSKRIRSEVPGQLRPLFEKIEKRDINFGIFRMWNIIFISNRYDKNFINLVYQKWIHAFYYISLILLEKQCVSRNLFIRLKGVQNTDF